MVGVLNKKRPQQPPVGVSTCAVVECPCVSHGTYYTGITHIYFTSRSTGS